MFIFMKVIFRLIYTPDILRDLRVGNNDADVPDKLEDIKPIFSYEHTDEYYYTSNTQWDHRKASSV